MSGTQWQFACIPIVLNTVSASKDFKRRGIEEAFTLNVKITCVQQHFFRGLPDVNKSYVYIVILRAVKCSSFFCEFLLKCRYVEFTYICLFK